MGFEKRLDESIAGHLPTARGRDIPFYLLFVGSMERATFLYAAQTAAKALYTAD
jgi:hypothetical protein